MKTKIGLFLIALSLFSLPGCLDSPSKTTSQNAAPVGEQNNASAELQKESERVKKELDEMQKKIEAAEKESKQLQDKIRQTQKEIDQTQQKINETQKKLR